MKARPGVSIRLAVPSDAGRLAELLAGGALTAREEPASPAPYADALTEIVATPGNDVLVAELDGRIVGMCQVLFFRHIQHRGGRCAEVESVHVDAGMRSTGIGTALMADVVERARAAGCYRVQLTSNVARPAAHRWYERIGFTGTHTGFKRYLDAQDDEA